MSIPDYNQNSNLSSILNKHTARKMSNIRLYELYKYANSKKRLISDSRLEQLEQCGDYLEFATDGINTKLVRGNFCHIRLCPICCYRRSLKLFAQMSQMLDRIEEDDSDGRIRWLFLTLTIRNVTGENLKIAIDDMIKGFNRMFTTGRTTQFNKKLTSTLLGYMRAIEVTYNAKNDTYHPHVHVLMAVDKSYFNDSGKYLKKADYATMWADSLKIDYSPVVDIRPVTGGKKAICETAKYPTKLDDVLNVRDIDLASNAVRILHTALHRRHLVVFGGLLKTVRKTLKQEDIEKTNLNDGISAFSPNSKISEICYRWNYRIGAYFTNK